MLVHDEQVIKTFKDAIDDLVLYPLWTPDKSSHVVNEQFGM